MIDKLVLFGATGDLAGRLLLPAVAALHAADRLPDGFCLVGTAVEDWDEDRFRRHVAERLEKHAAVVPSAAREELVRALRYEPVDVTDPDSVARVLSVGATGSGSDDDGTDDRPLVAYLALPPTLFPATVETLGKVGLPSGSRVALEKPFGHDVESAQALNRLLEQVAGDAAEQAVFRVDHTLGMPTMMNLIGLRMANPFLEAVWNSTYVQEVDVFWEETLGLEGRAGYYDQNGALEDVLQNHMLQVLALVAMEPPRRLREHELRDAKVAALRSVRQLTEDEVVTRTRRARYTAGRLADTGGADGEEVPDYVHEDGVDPSRDTETCAEVLLELDSPRWSGTRFRLRTGKALSARRKGVLLTFRAPGTSDHPRADDDAERSAGSLWIGVDEPNDLTLHMTGCWMEGSGLGLVSLELSGQPPAAEFPPYGHVLLNVLSGDSALSVRGDEAVEQWRVVTPIPEVWASGRPPMLDYPAGSSGPPLLERGRAAG